MITLVFIRCVLLGILTTILIRQLNKLEEYNDHAFRLLQSEIQLDKHDSHYFMLGAKKIGQKYLLRLAFILASYLIGMYLIIGNEWLWTGITKYLSANLY